MNDIFSPCLVRFYASYFIPCASLSCVLLPLVFIRSCHALSLVCVTLCVNYRLHHLACFSSLMGIFVQILALLMAWQCTQFVYDNTVRWLFVIRADSSRGQGSRWEIWHPIVRLVQHVIIHQYIERQSRGSDVLPPKTTETHLEHSAA